MAGFQFVHVETYGRKPGKSRTGTSFVFREAQRRPGCCEHVEQPGEPVTVWGDGLAVIEVQHDGQADESRLVDSTGKARKFRQDQHTLLTVVASHPATPGQVRDDPAVAVAVAEWQRLTVEWLHAEHGDRLRSVVRHDDEGHVHLHAYVLPDDPAMKARLLHPGVQAKEAAVADAVAGGMDSKAANRAGDVAYRAAMRGWQDSYWEKVGLPCGLARLGPGRRRLSRASWQAEQAQVERVAGLAGALAEVVRVESVLQQAAPRLVEVAAAGDVARALVDQVAELKAERDAVIAAAEVAKADADRIRAEAKSSATTIIGQAKRQAVDIVAAARREVEALRGIGVALGAAFGGMVQAVLASSPSRVAEAVRADEQEAARVRESVLLSANRSVRNDLVAMTRERDDAHQLVRQVVGELDTLRQVVACAMPGMRISSSLPPVR